MMYSRTTSFSDLKNGRTAREHPWLSILVILLADYGLAYDWFPTEGNYNYEDVTIAHNCLYSETEEEEVGMEQTAENMVNPVTLTTTVGHTTYNSSVPVCYEVRIVDCIYHARLFNKIDLKSRIAALRTITYPQK